MVIREFDSRDLRNHPQTVMSAFEADDQVFEGADLAEALRTFGLQPPAFRRC